MAEERFKKMFLFSVMTSGVFSTSVGFVDSVGADPVLSAPRGLASSDTAGLSTTIVGVLGRDGVAATD